ncbi:MAG: hypothetical protein PHF20_08450 [Halothiobacillaceae bacterium]|nr:hypothetical protein [Halothiobacillaceae bacterium]
MNSEAIELAILAQNTLGAYAQTRLLWPDHLALPQPGEHLQLHNGECLYPMFSPREGQLEVLSQRAPSSLKRAALTGTSIIQPALDEPIVILAHGIELATLIYICSQRRHSTASTLALYQLDDPAPFRPRPSRFLLPDMPHGVIAAIPLLEDWGIASRLCSTETRAGCFEGSLDELLVTLKSKHTVIHLSPPV